MMMVEISHKIRNRCGVQVTGPSKDVMQWWTWLVWRTWDETRPRGRERV